MLPRFYFNQDYRAIIPVPSERVVFCLQQSPDLSRLGPGTRLAPEDSFKWDPIHWLVNNLRQLHYTMLATSPANPAGKIHQFELNTVTERASLDLS